MTTTSAAARYSTARTVISPVSPGPAPTKATRPGCRAWRAVVLVVFWFERVGLTGHAPCESGLDGSHRGRRADWRFRSPRLGLVGGGGQASPGGAPGGR